MPKDADVLQIHFEHTTPKVAQAGAEAFAAAYFDYSKQRAQDQIDAQAQSISDSDSPALRPARATPLLVRSSKRRSRQVQSSHDRSGRLLVDAVVPTRPTSPNLLLNIALAAVLGAFVGLIAAFVRERMDDRLRGRDDLEEVDPRAGHHDDPGGPVVAGPATSAFLVTLQAPRSPAAEAYRTLRTSILVAAADHGYKTLMVVSAIAGEGKTTTAANLAVVLAQADKRVVLDLCRSAPPASARLLRSARPPTVD